MATPLNGLKKKQKVVAKPIKGFGAAMNVTKPPVPTPASTGIKPPNPNAVMKTDNVVGIANRIMAVDSPLMQRARTRGMQIANRRGLLNSSMAAGATQAEMVDAAVPLATTQAQINSQRLRQGEAQKWQSGESALDRDQQRFLQESEQKWRSGEAGRDRSLQKYLQDQELKWRTGEAKREREQQQRLQIIEQAWRSGESALDRNSQQKLQKMEQQWRSLESEADRSLQERIAKMQVSSSNQRSAETMVTNFHSLYQNTIANIMANTKISSSERTKQIEAAKANLADQTNLAERLFKIDIDWNYNP